MLDSNEVRPLFRDARLRCSVACSSWRLIGLGFLLSVLLSVPCAAMAAPAEWIFINGKIATVDANDSIV